MVSVFVISSSISNYHWYRNKGEKLYFDYESAWTPKQIDIFQKQPSRVTVPLYGYQLKSLKWMKGITHMGSDNTKRLFIFF